MNVDRLSRLRKPYLGFQVSSPTRAHSELIRSALAILVVLLGGCGQVTSNGGPSPAPSPSQSPSPAAPAPCRMPAILRVDQGGNREVVGYLALPSVATTDDPTDAIVKVADFPLGGGATVPVWGTTTSPQLFGVALGTYSRVAGRWLPAPPELVSPDGRHYSYLHPNGTLRVAAADGSEIPIPNPNNLTPLAFTGAGVVLVQDGPASNGLWLLDPATRSVTAITPPAGTDDWREVSAGLAFGLNSPGVLGAPQGTAVLAANVAAGSTPRTVFTAGIGSTIALIATDRQGGLLVVVAGSSPGLVYLDPNTGLRSVTVPAGVGLATIGPRHHADAHGIWFIGGSGIFLFNSESGFQQVAPGVTTDVAPAGDCV